MPYHLDEQATKVATSLCMEVSRYASDVVMNEDRFRRNSRKLDDNKACGGTVACCFENDRLRWLPPICASERKKRRSESEVTKRVWEVRKG